MLGENYQSPSNFTDMVPIFQYAHYTRLSSNNLRNPL